MKTKQVMFWLWFVKFIPKTIKYFCFIDVMSHSTTGKYSSTVVPELTGMEALKRYSEDFNIE